MAQLSSQELSLLLRLAQSKGRLVHPNSTDELACVRYDADVEVVRALATYGLVTRPLTAPNHDGHGRYRACLAPLTERGREALRSAACLSQPPSPC